MKKNSDELQSRFKEHFKTLKKTWSQNVPTLKVQQEDLEFILNCLKTNVITLNLNNAVEINSNDITTPTAPKKRGRKPKASVIQQEEQGRSDSSDRTSVNDSISSTSSNRSRRAAAQAAEQKLAQVQSFIKATKLRRPTDFNEKQNKESNHDSPSRPPKCRRTQRNQSAGSSPKEEEDIYSKDVNNQNLAVVENATSNDRCLSGECTVSVEQLNTPKIISLVNAGIRINATGIRTKKESKDLFDDCSPTSQLVDERKESKISKENKQTKGKTLARSTVLNSTHTIINPEKTSGIKSKNSKDSGISSNEEEIIQCVNNTSPPNAHSSPINLTSPVSGEEFMGFGELPLNMVIGKQTGLLKNNRPTFVIENEVDCSMVLETECVETDVQIVRKIKSEKMSPEAIEIEASCVRSRTKVLRKRGNQVENKEDDEEKENNKHNNKVIVGVGYEESPTIDSRIKVDKKENSEAREGVETTTNLKKHRDNNQQPESGNEIESDNTETNIRSRTKTIKKKPNNDSSEEESNLRSRTNTIRREVKTDAIDSENNLRPEFKEPAAVKSDVNKNIQLTPKSPAPARGELVKKRVEDFEKIQNGTGEVEEIMPGRVTRNAARKIVAESETSKKNQELMQLAASIKKSNKKSLNKQKRKTKKEDKENVPISKVVNSASKHLLSSERPRVTPLATNNRVLTPGIDSSSKNQIINKWMNSASRPAPIESSTAFVQKQAAEEAEKRRKEEERKKRQAKEEDAQKKKQKTLKASAEETRRKREEKLQKVAAAREAAERQKEMLAAKTEKEKEEKLRLINAENERLREEQLLKKKQIQQQKNLEHEKRRKQEEAARLAKLKEQEEEHKRVLAIKEREQEMVQKQQKADLRLAEAERAKYQGGKLGKLAAANSAKLKLQQVTTPAQKTNVVHPAVESYELTPAREDRPPLKPKTENDYGIDDAKSEDSSDDETRPKKVIPFWAHANNRDSLLLVNSFVPSALWNLFMECNKSPDLYKIFPGCNIKKRTRTSSAVWRTPPKYS